MNLIIFVIRKLVRFDDLLFSVLLVLKEIKGNICKCVGCFKLIMFVVVGYYEVDD